MFFKLLDELAVGVSSLPRHRMGALNGIKESLLIFA